MKRIYVLVGTLLFAGIVAAQQSTTPNQTTQNKSSTKLQLTNIAKYNGVKPVKAANFTPNQTICKKSKIQKNSSKNALPKKKSPLREGLSPNEDRKNSRSEVK